MRSINAPIQAVTVYTNRAKITRRGAVYMRAGEHIVTLSDLPMSLESDSVRATSTDPRFKIIDLDVKIETIDTHALPGVVALQRRYDELTEQHEALLDEDSVEASRLAFLQDIRQSASRGFGDAIGQGSLPLEQINALMAFISQEEQAIQTRRRHLAKQRRQLLYQMGELQAKAPQGVHLRRVDENKPTPPPPTDETLEAPPRSNSPFSRSLPFSARLSRSEEEERPFRRQPDNRRKSIELLVRAETDGEFPLTITYAVQDAKWEPFYDIRVLDDQQIAISFMGQIQQHTGEDWPAVPLTLSTSRPVQNANMPKIRPWVIDAEEPEPPRLLRRSNEDSNAQRRPFGAFRPAQPPPPPSPPRSLFGRLEVPSHNESDATDLDDIAPTLTFEVQHLIAIPSDNTPRKADIATLSMTGEIDCIAIPSQAEIAYLCAKIKNTTERTLLQGTALIFYDTQYIGKTEMKTLPPKDSVTVQIGGQEHIRVQRQLHEHSVNKAVDDYMRRTEFIYRISITNDGHDAVSLTVYDHIPITRNKHIKVMMRAVSPQPLEQTDMNIFRWRLELEPGQRQEIALGFAVEHPRDMKIVNKR